MELPRVKPGDPITADLFNALIDVLKRSRLSIGQNSGLVLIEGNDGLTLTTALASDIWGKTTGAISGGQYPFTQQREDTSGTWVAGPITGTAYEITGNTTVATNTYIRLTRSAAGDWRFKAGTC